MTDLILYLGIAFIGYVIANKCKDKKEKFSWTGKAQTIAIVIFILAMGLRMGANREVIDNLSTIGLSALLFTILILAIVVMCLFITRKLLGLNRYGLKDAGSNKHEKVKIKLNSMTILIVVSVLIGMALGYFVCLPLVENGTITNLGDILGNVIRVGLCILLLFVGLDLGFSGNFIDRVKSMGFRILIFPIVCILSSMIGGLVTGFILNISVRESLAIACGFGWYSLAPGIIIDAGYVTSSAISFLHNVLREIVSIITIPIVAQKIGYIEAAVMPGAPGMDVCLPVVEKSTSMEASVYGFASGVILSTAVPILVPLIINL